MGTFRLERISQLARIDWFVQVLKARFRLERISQLARMRQRWRARHALFRLERISQLARIGCSRCRKAGREKVNRIERIRL